MGALALNKQRQVARPDREKRRIRLRPRAKVTLAKVIHQGNSGNDNRDFEHSDHGDGENHGDHDDNRDFTQTFTYLSDQDKILLAKNGRGELTLYLDGRGIDEHLAQLGPRGVKAYIADHLGTVINGESVNKKRAVAAFGESLAATSAADDGGNHAQGTSISSTSDPAQYAFGGRTLDLESGLYFNRARSYDPTVGRFMSTDPAGFRGGINLYAYTRNNPLLYTDPSGQICGSPTNPYTLAALAIALGLFGEGVWDIIEVLSNPNLKPAAGTPWRGKNLLPPAWPPRPGAPGFIGPLPQNLPDNGSGSGGESGTDPNTGGFYGDPVGGNAGPPIGGGPGDAGGVTAPSGGSYDA